MDPKTAERITQLANNLKRLHLASGEDAYERAKAIVLGSSSEEDKSIGELMADTEKETANKKKELDSLEKAENKLEKKEELLEDDKELTKIEEQLDTVKETLAEDELEHSGEKSSTEEVDKEIVDEEHDYSTAEDTVDSAEEVQNKQ